MSKRLAILGLLLATATACTSHIVPLRPVQKVEVWVPDDPASSAPAVVAASAPTTEASATAASAPTTAVVATTGAATAPATQPGHMITKIVDPNRTTRFVYDASFDNVWKQAQSILTDAGFALDRQDYRLGVMTTRPLPSAQFLEFWKPQHTGVTPAMENTLNNQRRWITVSIATVDGKPKFYEIGIQVMVERESNPTEDLGGPIFAQGSGFGRNAIALRSDYADPKDETDVWSAVGHDPDLERKLLEALFKRI